MFLLFVAFGMILLFTLLSVAFALVLRSIQQRNCSKGMSNANICKRINTTGDRKKKVNVPDGIEAVVDIVEIAVDDGFDFLG